jgi:hypothetical protein
MEMVDDTHSLIEQSDLGAMGQFLDYGGPSVVIEWAPYPNQTEKLLVESHCVAQKAVEVNSHGGR